METESKQLTKEMILEADDLSSVKVDVPEWNGYLYVRSMTGAERDMFESSLIEQRGKSRKMNMANVRAKLVTLVATDEEGNRLFTNRDVEALGKKNAKALDRIFTEARKLNGISDEDIEELTKELEDNPFDGSVSD